MPYWMPITPISNSLRLIDLQGDEISEEQKGLFNFFETHLIDIYKEGNLIFIYRGESLKGLRRKLFSNHEDFSKERLYERLFIVGDKARHFFMGNVADPKNRGWLTNINDCSPETFGFMFERIAKVVSTKNLELRIQQSCSSRFLSYFCERNNHENFTKSVETFTKDNDQDRLKLRDYYLYFLHVAGSSGVREETMLVSTSLSVEVARGFSGKGEDGLILYGFIPQPYHNFLISPWLASEYHKIASDNGLPTYQPFGLFPEQLEISVKGALFSCFMIGVKQVENEDFVVNPHIFNIQHQDYKIAGKYGIPVQEKDFINSILASRYMRFISSDLQGNFEQYDIQR